MGEVVKLNYKYMLVCPQKAKHILCPSPLIIIHKSSVGHDTAQYEE